MRPFCFLCSIVSAAGLISVGEGQTIVAFPDAQLEAAVRASIAKPTGALNAIDLAGLTSLSASGQHIVSLYGLEWATNLTNLRLSGNRITDLVPLQNLNHLVQLALDNNLVSDISPLAGLSGLALLDLSWNRLTDGAGLSGLTNLNHLALRANSITNTTSLKNLGGLTFLNLEENQISDLTPLASLGSLGYLGLTQNPATNWVVLSNLTNLVNLEISGEGIGNLSFVSRMTELNYLDASYNRLLDLSPLSGLTNLTQLVLGGNAGIETPQLARLTNLSGLWLFGTGISDLSFLEATLQLRYLDVSDNAIGNLSPLAALTNLTGLGLRHVPASSFSPIAALSELTTLALDGDPIGDGSFLSGMGRLNTLSVPRAGLRDLNRLSGLTNLSFLYAEVNLLTNIDGIANLDRLSRAELIGNLLSTNAGSAPMMEIARLRSRGVEVNYDPQNQPPTILALGHWYVPANQVSSFTCYLADDYASNDELMVTASPSNPGLFANVSLEFGTNYARTITVTPVLNQVGTSRMTLTVTEDGTGLSTTTYVDVTVLFPTNVVIPDSDLLDAVLATLGSPGGDVTSVDLLALTNLYVTSSTFSDLSGLEWASNLMFLSFDNASVSNLAPLRNLTQLTFLSASDNYLDDISPLADLTNLTHLDLSWNPITNHADVLPRLGALSSLSLAGDSLRDVESLRNLRQLTTLDLTDNWLTNIAPLIGLTNLGVLSLQQNLLSDISPATNLVQLMFLDFSYNLVNSAKDLVTASLVDRLRSRKVLVSDGPPRQLSFISLPGFWFVSTNSTSTLTFSTADNAPYPDVLGVEARVSDTNLVPEKSLLLGTDGSGNWTITATPAAGHTGVARISLTLTNQGLSTNAIVNLSVVIPQAVGLTDPNLKSAILSAVGKTGGNVTTLDLLSLTSLNLADQNISNVFGLGFATNLTSLYLDDGSITDVAPLGKLPQLTLLSLSNNFVGNISPLAPLSKLVNLNLGRNPVTNYDAFLSGFESLTNLNLGQSFLSNVFFLTNLTSLTTLDLDANRLADLSPLGSLTNLVELHLQHNLLATLSPLPQLPQLRYLDARLNLLDLRADSAALSQIASLATAGTFVDYVPQREAPTFQIASEWTVPRNQDSTLFFNLLENGQSGGGGYIIQATSSNTNLVPNENLLVASEGDSDWVLQITPTVDQTGDALIHLVATNDAGLGTAISIAVSVVMTRSVTDLFSSSLTTGGDEPWFGPTDLSFQDGPVVQSGGIGSGGDSWLQANLQGPGILSYWWKVSSETNYDFLQFESPQLTNSISGDVDWQLQTVYIPPGISTVVWRYTKDPVCCADGLDAGWIGDIQFRPGSWLEIVARTANNRCGLLLHGALTHTYEVQVSSDLALWVAFASLKITNASMPFIDSAASNTSRFYRLLDVTR